jgi:hypothetical protein
MCFYVVQKQKGVADAMIKAAIAVRGSSVSFIALQRHFNALTEFAHVESRFCGRKRREKAALDTAISGSLLSTVISTRYILGFRKDNPNVFNSLIQSWPHF